MMTGRGRGRSEGEQCKDGESLPYIYIYILYEFCFLYTFCVTFRAFVVIRFDISSESSVFLREFSFAVERR